MVAETGGKHPPPWSFTAHPSISWELGRKSNYKELSEQVETDTVLRGFGGYGMCKFEVRQEAVTACILSCFSQLPSPPRCCTTS